MEWRTTAITQCLSLRLISISTVESLTARGELVCTFFVPITLVKLRAEGEMEREKPLLPFPPPGRGQLSDSCWIMLPRWQTLQGRSQSFALHRVHPATTDTIQSKSHHKQPLTCSRMGLRLGHSKVTTTQNPSLLRLCDQKDFPSLQAILQNKGPHT